MGSHTPRYLQPVFHRKGALVVIWSDDLELRILLSAASQPSAQTGPGKSPGLRLGVPVEEPGMRHEKNLTNMMALSCLAAAGNEPALPPIMPLALVAVCRGWTPHPWIRKRSVLVLLDR